MSELSYVVVGGGLAAAMAVEGLRERGTPGRVLLIGEEQEPPYERPPLSKDYLAGQTAAGKLYVHEPDWYAGQGVELLLGTRVGALDRQAREVELVGGTRIGYDRLLLATGSSPRKLPVPGTDLEGVHYLRRVGHADGIRAAIERGGPLVVIGAGWIGLEVAAVARQAGLDVTVVESQQQPLAGVLGAQVGAVFAALHRDNGVMLRLGAGVEALLGDGSVEAVRLAGGTLVPAASVLVGIGARPRTELAAAAGLDVDDGVLVDASLQTSDPAVWAAGDIAAAQNEWAGRRLRVEHYANATDQGAMAGRVMAGAQERWAKPPYFWTDQYDLAMEYRGWADPARSTVVLRGGPEEGVWFAFWLDGETVRAAMHVNGWDDAEQVKALVVERARVDPRALGDVGTGWEAVRRG